MRSQLGGVLVVLSLATALVLVLVLLQTAGLRGDLDATRSELVELRQQVEGVERGIPMGELSLRLAELENDIQAWVVAFSEDVPSGDPTTPAGGASAGEILERLDELLDRVEALDARVDEICGNVPVC